MDDERHIELLVPDEVHRRPRGAAIGADGTGACVSCGDRFPLRVLDVVGNGYRCIRCTEQAEVTALEQGRDVDITAHLTPQHRAELRRTGTRDLALGSFLLLLVIPGFLLTVETGVAFGLHLTGLALATGLGMVIVGWSRRRAAGP